MDVCVPVCVPMPVCVCVCVCVWVCVWERERKREYFGLVEAKLKIYLKTSLPFMIMMVLLGFVILKLAEDAGEVTEAS